jgi:GNAT superfamily N-acetyltransferase
MHDVPALHPLIEASVRALSTSFLSPEQIEAELTHVISLDTTLIADGTYFVAVAPDGSLAGAGGWSRRRALHGGDAYKLWRAEDTPDALVDPRTEPARIRQMFTHPAWARRGVARAIFEAARAAAAREGYTRLVLTATMPGLPLYRALGFTVDREYHDVHPNGVEVPIAEMSRAT